MANEFKHKSVGEDLSRNEWEGIDTHEADGQTTGDIIYYDGVGWIRLPIGTSCQKLVVKNGIPTWNTCGYAEMYFSGTSTAQIDTQDAWLAGGGFVEGVGLGFTFISAIKKSITTIADGGGGEITCTATAHGFSAGDYISITGTTDYNDLYEIQSVTTDTFNVIATYTSSQTGQVVRGSAFKVNAGSEGEYKITGSFSGLSVDVLQTFEFSFAINTAVQTKTVATRKYATNDIGNTTHTGLVTLSVNDVVYPVVRNTTGTGDFTLYNGNINIHSVG